MPLLACGAAVVDRSGAVVAADGGFIARLGLRADDPSGSFRARAAAVPALRALLAGEGRAVVRVPGADGGDIDVERIGAGDGTLLVLRAAHVGEWLEHAMRSIGLGKVAGGVAHDIKNPLNAMSLQLALLGEKLAGSPEASAAAAAHLVAIRGQIGRVNEVLRRFLDVAEPAAPLGCTDLGALLADVANLLGHEGRCRRMTLSIDAPLGVARSSADPARAGRLVLGLFARALAEVPDGGRLAARVEASGRSAVIAIEHTPGEPDATAAWWGEVSGAVAEALGGQLAQERREDRVRLSLALPRVDPG